MDPPSFWDDVFPALSPEKQELFSSQLRTTFRDVISSTPKVDIHAKIVHVTYLFGPPFEAEKSTWSEANQKLFDSPFDSLRNLDDKRQWIILHVLAAKGRGVYTFFIPILGGEYMVIYSKEEFAALLGIIDTKENKNNIEDHFGIYVQLVPKVLFLAIANYKKTYCTPDTDDPIDWRIMAQASRLLANSDIAHLKSVYNTSCHMHKVVYITGKRSSTRERDLLDGVRDVEVLDGAVDVAVQPGGPRPGGVAVQLSEKVLAMLRCLSKALHTIGGKDGKGWRNFDEIQLFSSNTTDTFSEGVYNMFVESRRMGEWKELQKNHMGAMEEFDGILKSNFGDMYDFEPNTASLSNRKGLFTTITASILRSMPETSVQRPHVDYQWNVSGNAPGSAAAIAFLPLDINGLPLLIWTGRRTDRKEGILIFIPFGVLLILPMYCIHAGGFAIRCNANEAKSNYRMHFYLQHGINLDGKDKVSQFQFPDDTPNFPDQTYISMVKATPEELIKKLKHVFKWKHVYPEPE